jgi:hypothetical protein
MSISDKQRKLFFLAARKVGFSEEQRRAILAGIAGVESVNELDQDGFDVMMAFLEHCGFAPQRHGQDFGERPGMASFAQLELIRAMWREYTNYAYGQNETQLEKWLASKFKVSHMRFLTADTARKAITALKTMKARRKST